MSKVLKEFLKKNNAVLLEEADNYLKIGLPKDDPYLKDIVRRLAGKDVAFEILEKELLEKLEGGVLLSEELNEEELALETPIVKLVNELLEEAIKVRATDIHIEPFEKEFYVKYRIDGILHTVRKFPKYLHAAVVSRIKILSQLNIAEKRLPQDGKFSFLCGKNEYDIRVSTLPTIYGESLVLRILNKSTVEIKLEHLGFNEKNMMLLRKLIQFSNGMILVTGPTGSGKTTTLYALLKLINDGTKKIITIEDPVEYTIDGITQVQVNEKIGLSFAKILRSILRQDPDVIMLGEIRDGETAEIAVRAALTGHLVLATLHTNDSLSSFSRLIDMGVESFLVSSAVIGVVSQRLVRKICPNCIEAYAPSDYEKRIFEINNLSVPSQLYRGKGCEHCNYTGYKGRTVIAEALKINDDIRKLVVRKEDAVKIREKAMMLGMEPIIVDGLKKAKSGVTTFSEVIRVCNY